MRRSILLVTLALGCTPTLTRTMIVNHPKLSLEAMKPRVVESSSPIAPTWVFRLDRGAVDFVPFTGQAYAATLEEAKAGATRDLVAAVASYVAVDVASELEVTDSERTVDGQTSGSSDVKRTTRTRAAASLKGVSPDEVFWEKILVSPLVPDRHAYRAYVHARVKRAVITKARLAKQLAREKSIGRRMLVVLPFRSATPTPEARRIERAFAEELSRRLGAGDELFVGDPGMVDGLVDTNATEAEALQTIREALLPDLVVGGSYQVHEGRVKVTYTLYDTQRAVKTGSAMRSWKDLFGLQDEVAERIAKAVGAAGKRSEVRPPDPEAMELYWAAYERYRAGDNDGAISLLSKALTIDPSDARTHLRLGRVYERIGRYGTTRPREPTQRNRAMIALCTPWFLVTPEEPERFLDAAANEPVGRSKDRVGADLDDIASALTYALAGDGPMPRPAVPAVAVSAIGAYWNAFAHARRSGDVRLVREVRIAIADLLLRVDRINVAVDMFGRIANEAGLASDLHHEALALLGLGRAKRNEGRVDQARKVLLSARKIRRRTLERPYLLEIENELGQLEVEVSRFRQAAAHYSEALRIADDLDDEYFRAVLGNNLGVLELIEGRADRAEAFFHRAWRALTNIDEVEGRTATSLNVGYLAGTRGDLEAARTYLETARELASSSRRAAVLAHEGRLSRLAGKHLDALRALLMSYAIYERAGRRQAIWRLDTNIAAAELGLALADVGGDFRERVACVQRRTNRVMATSGRSRRFGRQSLDYLYAYLTWTVARSLR